MIELTELQSGEVIAHDTSIRDNEAIPAKIGEGILRDYVSTEILESSFPEYW